MAEGKLGRTNTGKRLRLDVTGIVQGVGFRPYIYRLARHNHLGGFVLNQAGKVSIEIEGRKGDIDSFYHALSRETAAPARIEALRGTVLLPTGQEEFFIKQSEKKDEADTAFPSDLAICSDCLAEIYDKSSRFYHYPFTSCTNCGPRYSVIEALPYDRENTSMKTFRLCEACQNEYGNPDDRRFHAQTIACPACGPQMRFLNKNGKEQQGDWLSLADTLLGESGILAVKGLGGFHLMCEASSRLVIDRLRERKHRPRKPLALMAADVEVVEKYFDLDEGEKQTLQSSQAPIVLLRPNKKAKEDLPLSSIAPGLKRIGVMLAYTPLHHLLFGKSRELMVATSGNRSGLPIATTNQEALVQLTGMADGFLVHNRKIVTRIDDSVGQYIDGRFSLIRRARGFVPDTLPVPLPLRRKGSAVLGGGAEMKNTFCVLEKDKALLGQHIGDIDNLEILASYHGSLEHILTLLERKPEMAAYDPHPGYQISKEIKANYEMAMPVYHHHAHMAACMVEHQLSTPVIGCILDGTGYGNDDSLWGFEILSGDYVSFERQVHLQPMRLPGGEAAIKHPWMTAVALIDTAVKGNNAARKIATALFPEEDVAMVYAQLKESMRVSSAGRLFDAVAAMLGLCKKSSYEGEAAVLLSELAEERYAPQKSSMSYTFSLDQQEWKIDQMIREILKDITQGEEKEIIAIKFHHTIAEMVVSGVCNVIERLGNRPVILSGGVWQNPYLVKVTKRLLEKKGLTVYTHRQVPAGDGGIALGQAVIAKWRCADNDVSIDASESD